MMNRPRLHSSILAISLLALTISDFPAHDNRPPSEPSVVGIGDSYMSGEGGRYWGNFFDNQADPQDKQRNDLGEEVYFDDQINNKENIPDCHRLATNSTISFAKASKNLACSGSTVTTKTTTEGQFKPGLDFYEGPKGSGQLAELVSYAKQHRVRDLVVQTGKDDFNFGEAIRSCISGSIFDKPCRDDEAVKKLFNEESIGRATKEIKAALSRVREAMEKAGYKEDAYRIIVENYGIPVPNVSDVRYVKDERQDYGLPLLDEDLEWINEKAFPAINNSIFSAYNEARGNSSNWVFVDTAKIFQGKEVGAKSTLRIDEIKSAESGKLQYAKEVEWINGFATFVPDDAASFHPNHWGHLAQQDCIQKIVQKLTGAPKADSYRCTPGVSDTQPVAEVNSR